MSDGSQPSQSKILGVLIGIVIAVALVVGAFAMFAIDWSGERGNRLPKQFDYDLSEYMTIDPALVHYKQTATIPIDLIDATGIAVGPEDRIYVAGDEEIVVYNAEGVDQSRIEARYGPRCVAVGDKDHAFPGRIYVGLKSHVEVYTPKGTLMDTWSSLGEKAVLTSIAVGEKDIYVADAGNRIVHRYDTEGKLLGKIGERAEGEGIPFVIPSPYFDCAISPDGLLRVVNPGAHRIEAYTFEGLFEEPLTWGKPTTGIEGFCGCCNPCAIAILSDERIVTAEKGLPRVKVYAPLGEFECVVAGPDLLAMTKTANEETRTPYKPKPVDLAVDSRDRILVLDPSAALVRIFEHDPAKTKPAKTKSGENETGDPAPKDNGTSE